MLRACIITGFRYYQPWIGRWLNPDPAGTIDGLNVYAFVTNNPISFIDKGGMGKKRFFSTNASSRYHPYSSGKSSYIGRVRDNPSGPSDSEQPWFRSYKSGTYRVHWKGYRDSSGKTTGVEPSKAEGRGSKPWSKGHKNVAEKMTQMLRDETDRAATGPRNNVYVENSHLIAAINWGPNDELSAPPASAHQNTEWLAIETGVKALIKSGMTDMRIKVTGYVYDSSNPDKAGMLKASRYKIYLNGKKVFDHFSDGERTNIDRTEANRLTDHIKELTHASPSTELHRWFFSSKGLSDMPPPSQGDIEKGQKSSAKSPMFTDVEDNKKIYTGQAALDHVKSTYYP